MNNNIEKLWNNFKNNKDIDVNFKEEIRNIDNSIKEKDIDLKKKVLLDIEDKYKEILDARGYYKIKNMVDAKTYMVNNEKELNTLLGNLKVWIVRIAYLENNQNEEINKIYSNIEKEKDIEKIYKLLDKADSLMI